MLTFILDLVDDLSFFFRLRLADEVLWQKQKRAHQYQTVQTNQHKIRVLSRETFLIRNLKGRS